MKAMLFTDLQPDYAPKIMRRSVKTMNIVFFNHPDFSGHVSLPRFSKMLNDGMRKRGHRVENIAPEPNAFNLPVPKKLKKWSGYIDQFLLFPRDVKRKLSLYPKDTLFVFTDNALGPWVPLVENRPHVIHCHDFMAQQSAKGMIPESPTGWTGRQYQKMIFNGYNKGRNFISGSQNTRTVLHEFLSARPLTSELVYNGLHQRFEPFDTQEARSIVGKELNLDLKAGYILHVGGNQWYKNRFGIIEIYNAWRASVSTSLPLILIGLPPSAEVLEPYNNSPYKSDIHFVTNASDKVVNVAYSGATVFLFPSCAEGFGWPIAEAMASGCPVITTNEAPMTEVAGNAGFLVKRRPFETDLRSDWAKESAAVVDYVVSLSKSDRNAVVQASIENARRFDTERALDRIEEIYLKILDR